MNCTITFDQMLLWFAIYHGFYAVLTLYTFFKKQSDHEDEKFEEEKKNKKNKN